MEKKKRYPRNETLYNLIQENEIFTFLQLLPLAARCVTRYKTLWHGIGRPPKFLYDILVCLAVKEYFGKSLRRTMGILRLLEKFGCIDVDIPCFKTLNNYMNNPEIKPCLDKLIEITSSVLRSIEHFFATDSSGVCTSCFSPWYSIRTRKRIRKRDHIMVHVSTGTRLNGVSAVNVELKRGRDSVIFRDHVKKTSKNFMIKEWSGDATYLSRENCDAVGEVGGEPWFKPKSNVTSRAKGSYRWKMMIMAYREEPEKAYKKYHRRSNSEATFSAKNRKFGCSVRGKNGYSQINEELLRWIDYNFTVLARAKFEQGIIPEFAR